MSRRATDRDPEPTGTTDRPGRRREETDAPLVPDLRRRTDTTTATTATTATDRAERRGRDPFETALMEDAE